MHDDLAPVAFLLGTWEGTARGEYPTVEPFVYRECTRFTHDGRPFLFYEQRTWRTVGDREMPAHAEWGFWRCHADGRVEASIAQNVGLVEISVGTAGPGSLALGSTQISLAPSAKPVTGLWREYRREGDDLACSVDMAAMGVERAFHLEARLRRTAD